jgi:hypothetical protein
MRYYRLAIIAGIISVALVSSSYTLYHRSAKQAVINRATLTAIQADARQRSTYGAKMDAIRAGSAKLITLSSERHTNVEYEIELVDHDLAQLMSEIASTYAGGMFFLEEAVVESTSGGITVTMKGFKQGAPTP